LGALGVIWRHAYVCQSSVLSLPGILIETFSSD